MSICVRFASAVLCVLAMSPALSSVEKNHIRTTVPSTQARSASDVQSDYSRQVHPAMNLATLFPEAAQISIAVAVVPDPLVPRYRRLYDLDLVAIELGMLKNGYVLDRFFLPWNGKLQALESKRLGGTDETAAENSDATRPTGQSKTDESVQTLPFNRDSYGLMIFRCDAWRHSEDVDRKPEDPESKFAPSSSECAIAGGRSLDSGGNRESNGGSRFRALYIVTDTSTKGVESRALGCVMDRIASQVSVHRIAQDPSVPPQCWPWQGEPVRSAAIRPAVGLASYYSCDKPPPAATLVILGPTFSGAIDSFGPLSESLGRKPNGITHICLVSSSTSDDTNWLVSQRYPRVSYATLALDNRLKLLHIAKLTEQLMGMQSYSAPKAQVAILAEASTFGHDVCSDTVIATEDLNDRKSVRDLCNSARFFYFPANIADIRYGLQEQRDARRRSSALKLPVTSEHLSLELGAENGSEYPESRQSGLTSVSADIAMEQVLNNLKEVNPPPRVVIVVATDVRDRLFLFDELRDRLPRAMLIDLEADNLLGHPDFLHASRGALAMASVELNARVFGDRTFRDIYHSPRKPVESWSSDVQAMLARAVSCISDPTPPGIDSPCAPRPNESRGKRQAATQVITLEGFRRISNRFAFAPPSAAQQTLGDLELNAAEVGAPLLCTAAAWLWIYPLVIPRWRQGGLGRRWVRRVHSASLTVCAVYAALVLAVAYDVHSADHDNSIHLWIAVALIGGFSGLACCILALRRATRASPPSSYLNVCAPVLLALAATLMASAPLWWLRAMGNSTGKAVDMRALMQLGLDPGPGLAFLLLIALATLTLLCASAILGTGAAIVNRNSALLRAAQSKSAQPPEIWPRIKGNRRGIADMNPFGLLLVTGIAIVAMVGPDLVSGNVRLTIFGQSASVVALLAITATTCSAALLACSGIGAARRVAALSEHVRIARCGTAGGVGPGLWPLDNSTPRVFPATPVIATAAAAGRRANGFLADRSLTQWTRLLKQWLYGGADSSDHRVAIFTLLATEISLYRWSVAGAVLSALASIGAVYLFPIEADRLLLLNLVVLAVLGVTAGVVATAFERDELLSNVLCNRRAKRRFSTHLFAFISLPFIAFALAIAIANIPGVVDWGGGLLQLLGMLGVHP